jgi:hypothetical protein
LFFLSYSLPVEILIFSVPIVNFCSGEAFPNFCSFKARDDSLAVFYNEGTENKERWNHQNQTNNHRTHDDGVVKASHRDKGHIVHPSEERAQRGRFENRTAELIRNRVENKCDELKKNADRKAAPI